MVTPIDPTGVGFLLAENRSMPMHVGGLQLFRKPEGAGRNYAREMFEHMSSTERIAPLFLRHPHRSTRTAGQLVWEQDEQFDIEHHVRHSALPKPGRVRELLELVQPPAQHPARVGAAAVGGARHRGPARRPGGDVHQDPPLPGRRRLRDPADGERAVARPRQARHAAAVGLPRDSRPREASDTADVPLSALRTALGITAEAAGMPAALIKTLTKSVRNETSALSLYAPRTMLNQQITGSRRFAAQDWPIERLRGVGKATGTTINDVVLAMCGGALRPYLLDFDALPDETPGGDGADRAQGQGVAHRRPPRAATRSARSWSSWAPTSTTRPTGCLVHASMQDGKEALSSMTPMQILAMSALGQAPAILTPMLRM